MQMLTDELVYDSPDKSHVDIIMQREDASNKWLDYRWSVIGVTSSPSQTSPDQEHKIIFESEGIRRYLFQDFPLALYKDECESYYHNLMSPTPRCYVVCHQHDDEMPAPFLVTLSFDAAHSYLEGEEEIYAVDIPAEIYKWVESYVINNYVPQQRKKRKRDNWKDQQGYEAKNENRH